jgi:hypothetical protein
MAGPSEAIATYLQTGGYGTLGSSIFVDFSPPTPYNQVVVTQYSGYAPDRTVGQKLPTIQRNKVQVLVRNSSPSTALSTALAINDYIEGIAGITTGGEYIIFAISIGSGVMYLGKDSNNLTSYCMNFEVKTTS